MATGWQHLRQLHVAGATDRWLSRRVVDALRGSQVGTLMLRLPGSERVEIEGPEPPLLVEVRDPKVFRRILWDGDIGAGETYADGAWETNDLPALCARCLRATALWEAPSWIRLATRLKNAVVGYAQRNTLRGSRRNIAYHYDLSNELYALFLDPTMTYSCAEFSSPSVSLEAAQVAKLDTACRALELETGMRVLEIGSGWGSFALHAARRYGVSVTGITLSQRQNEWARRRAEEEGLADRVKFELCDYRHVRGRYDRIASIEMFEAVGHEYYADFFRAVNRCLAPGGKFFLQTITIPDQRYERYRREFDFIKKHIFPGGLLASLQRILTVVKYETQLCLEAMRDIGHHYATTLRIWRQRFLENRRQVLSLGFDRRFLRLWEFYLASCEAAFSIRHIGDAQLVFRKLA